MGFPGKAFLFWTVLIVIGTMWILPKLKSTVSTATKAV